MNTRMAGLALPLSLVLGLGACSDATTAPERMAPTAATAAKAPGSGLVLNSVTGLKLPVLDALGVKLGDVTVNQAVLTNFALVENTVGQIVGVQVDGVLQLTGGLLGTDVVTENFATTASVTSSGPGQCSLASIDLSGINIDALGVATVDLPAATLTGKGSGAVGSLLCNLGSVLSGLTGGGAGGLVNAINNQIGAPGA
jgi:hypothetical protein